MGTIPARPSDCWRPLLAAGAVSVLIALPALTGPAVYEDGYYLYAARSFALAPRGLTFLSLAGSAPFLAHVGNLLLHLLCGLLLFTVAARWMSPVRALAVSLVFLWHPLQGEAVYYIAGRSELLAGLGIIGVLWAYQRMERAWLASVVMIGCGLWAFAAKEVSAVCLVAIVPLCGWRYPRSTPDYRVWLPSCVWVVLILWAVSVRVAFPIAFASGVWMVSQVGSVWHLLRLMVWPVGQSIETPAVPVWQGQAGILLTFVLMTVALKQARRWPSLAFAVCWLTVAFLPRMLLNQPMPYPEPVHEHHAYVPLMGLLLGMGGWR